MVIYKKISVKWRSEKFDDLEMNTDEPPLLFKAQLFALTGVQPERQKIMFKGKMLKDDSWADFGVEHLKDGAQLMMMGSADSLPQAPAVKTVFLEDLTERQLAKAMALPAGLKNLGNTCYMNATLQCLKTVPELTEALKTFSGPALAPDSFSFQADQALTAAARDLYSSMDNGGHTEIIPLIMLNVLHQAMPQFAEKDDHGHFRQQDANEFWLELIRMFQNKLKIQDNTNVVSRYFGGRFEIELKCKENEAEPVSKTKEDFLQLSCFLSQEVKYLFSGLKAKMIEEIHKNSPTLNRDAVYEKISRISRLPAYLTIQMVRFFYKEKDQVNAKILKDVKFPMILDVYDLCSPDLQQKLLPARSEIKIRDDRDAEKERKIKKAAYDDLNKNGPGGSVEDMQHDSSGEAQKKYLPTSFDDDPGSNNSGIYELRAVLTHKGRSSASGHYLAWVKRAKNDWVMCDDDSLRRVDDEEILKLSGGGDWHCAYLLLYGPKMTET